MNGDLLEEVTVTNGETYERDFTGVEEYMPETFDVTMRGTSRAYLYDASSGVLTVAAIHGDTVIKVNELQLPRFDTPSVALDDDGITLTVTAASGATHVSYYADDATKPIITEEI
jgi:hypothetical protein